MFGSEEEQTQVFQIFSGTKKSQWFCSTTKNRVEEKQKEIFSKLFRNAEKRTDLFQHFFDQFKPFQERRETNGSAPKIFDLRKTNRFDSDLEEKNSEKAKVRLLLERRKRRRNSI